MNEQKEQFEWDLMSIEYNFEMVNVLRLICLKNWIYIERGWC